METRLKVVEDDLKELQCEVKDKFNKYDESINRISTDFLLLQSTINQMATNVTDIKTDLKELRKLREDDHYIKPLANSEKLKSQTVGVIIGILITAFFAFLFPQIM